jgi:hypothetical protein
VLKLCVAHGVQACNLGVPCDRWGGPQRHGRAGQHSRFALSAGRWALNHGSQLVTAAQVQLGAGTVDVTFHGAR